MNEDIEDEEEEFEEVSLNYTSYLDADNMSVIIKFNGFSDKDQMVDFLKYIDPYIPLILYNDKVKH